MSEQGTAGQTKGQGAQAVETRIGNLGRVQRSTVVQGRAEKGQCKTGTEPGKGKQKITERASTCRLIRKRRSKKVYAL